MIGKEIRMARLLDPAQGKTIIVPMDHGVSMGPVAGLVDIGAAIHEAALGGANAVVIHMGLIVHGGRGVDDALAGLAERCQRAA